MGKLNPGLCLLFSHLTQFDICYLFVVMGVVVKPN